MGESRQKADLKEVAARQGLVEGQKTGHSSCPGKGPRPGGRGRVGDNGWELDVEVSRKPVARL